MLLLLLASVRGAAPRPKVLRRSLRCGKYEVHPHSAGELWDAEFEVHPVDALQFEGVVFCLRTGDGARHGLRRVFPVGLLLHPARRKC